MTILADISWKLVTAQILIINKHCYVLMKTYRNAILSQNNVDDRPNISLVNLSTVNNHVRCFVVNTSSTLANRKTRVQSDSQNVPVRRLIMHAINDVISGDRQLCAPCVTRVAFRACAGVCRATAVDGKPKWTFTRREWTRQTTSHSDHSMRCA